MRNNSEQTYPINLTEEEIKIILCKRAPVYSKWVWRSLVPLVIIGFILFLWSVVSKENYLLKMFISLPFFIPLFMVRAKELRNAREFTRENINSFVKKS